MKRIAQDFNGQRGAAAVATAVILLLVATLVVLYAGKVVVMDQRMSGNEYRYGKAMTNAEAGLENRSAFLLYNGTRGLPFGLTYTNTSVLPYFSATIAQTASSYLITSTGYAYGADLTQGQAAVRSQFGVYKLFGKGPDAPLVVAGNVPPTGNMEIVGNPNGGGVGVDVAIWTNQAVDAHGSYSTCKSAEYWANGNPSIDSATGIETCAANSCSCDGIIDGRISNASGPGRDIVTDVYPTFPNDVFQYVTGIAHANYEDYKGDAKVHPLTPADCSNGTLNANTDGIYWVNQDGTADCRLPNNVGGASGDHCKKRADEVCSVVLFTENVKLVSTGGSSSQFFGVIFSFDRTTHIAADGTISDSNTGDNGTLQMAGSTTVNGIMVSDHDLHTGSSITGSFDLVYNRRVIESILNDRENQSLARVPGTWIDQ